MKLIELRDITKTYFLGEIDVPVLKGITLSIDQGEYVALMGASGSGKSTLMNILGCLDRQTSGDYLLEGEEVGRASGDRRAQVRNRKIGFVFQSFNLLPRTTALENVIMPLAYTAGGLSRRERRKRGIEMLERVGLADRVYHYPSQLSGGQQQRLCIARALAVEPEVLLMDEPTSALDPISTSKIEELCMELKGKYTIVIVTHNMQQALRIADTTAFFLLGDMVEVGATDQLFSMPRDKRTEDYITGRFG